jgi:putative protease
MPYELVVDGVTSELGDVKYLLSPKDLAGVNAIPELADIGVHGLKIEGRQKGPQYVATATGGYKRWIEAIANGDDRAAAEARVSSDLSAMGLSYTRGFSDGFLGGSDHQTLVEGRFPKHRGVFLGRVTKVTRSEVHVEKDERPWTGGLALERRESPKGERKVSLPMLGTNSETVTPRAGMGVVFDAGNPEDKNEPGGPIFRVETRGSTTILGFGNPGPDLFRVNVGDRVWITRDPTLAQQTEKLLEQGAPGRIALALRVEGRAGEPLRVYASGPRVTANTASATPLSLSSSRGIDEALLREKLGALGGTPFHLASIDTSALDVGLHLPVSELKTLRRALVAALESKLVVPHRIHPVHLELPDVAPIEHEPILVPLCRSDEQIDAAIESGTTEIELDWMELVGLSKAFARAKAAGLRVTVAGLRIEKPGEEGITDRIARLGPDAVLVRHWGALERFAGQEKRPQLIGDFSLNVTNSITARYLLARGLDVLTASFDLDDAQLFGLLDRVPRGRVAVVVHHRIPTFHTEHCLYAHLLSEGRDFSSCGRPCEERRIDVRDHLGKEHPVIVDAGCRNTVFNAEPNSAARLVPELLTRGVRRFRVDFVRENRDEARKILTTYRDLIAGKIAAHDVAKKLRARDQFGVGQGERALIVSAT